jgi:hypothetical protein
MEQLSEQQEIQLNAMAVAYPSLAATLREDAEHSLLVWEGWVQPIGSPDDLDAILIDLENVSPLHVSIDGAINSRKNPKGKLHSLSSRLRSPSPIFNIRIEYDDTGRHPRAYRTFPQVLPGSKHTFGDGRMCPYPPWEDVWVARRDTVVDFADQAMIWLVKRYVWDETSIWLGLEMSHDPVYLFTHIKPDEQCWCASSEAYSKCDREGDKKRIDSIIKNWIEKRGSQIDRIERVSRQLFRRPAALSARA